MDGRQLDLREATRVRKTSAVVFLWVVGCKCEQASVAPDPKVEADGHYVAGTSAYLKGDFVTAHTHFEAVKQLTPDDPRLPGAEGELLLSEGRVDDAIARFEQAISKDPRRSTSWSRLGLLYAMKGKMPDSKRALLKAIELNPKDFNAHESLGDAALEAHDVEEAVHEFLLASESAPPKAQAELITKAAAEWVKAKHPDQALAVLEAAKAKGISTPELNQDLGERYVEVARWDDAIAAYSAAAEQDPTAWELVAELHGRQLRFEDAKAAWKKAIAGRDVAVYHVGMANLCLAQKDRACAEQELDRALSTATGEELREATELADLLATMNRKSDALRLLEGVAGEDDQRKNESLQLKTARLAKALNRPEVVTACCERIAPAKCP